MKRLLVQSLEGPRGEASRSQAVREASINAGLDHPNIVATYSYDMKPMVAGPLVSGMSMVGIAVSHFVLGSDG